MTFSNGLSILRNISSWSSFNFFLIYSFPFHSHLAAPLHIRSVFIDWNTSCIKTYRKIFYSFLILFHSDNGLEGIFTDPKRSFNCDGSFFLIAPGKGKVLAELGCKDVYLSLKSSAKTGVSVLTTVSASGWILPPFLIYPYERAQRWMSKEGMPPSFEVFFTKKGRWRSMPSAIGCCISLFQNGRSRRFTSPLFCIWMATAVILISGFQIFVRKMTSSWSHPPSPNTTHILQACDGALFKRLKGMWKAKVHEWIGKHPTNKVTVKNMAHLLNEVCQNLSASYGQKGFRVCGLYPWNPDAVK